MSEIKIIESVTYPSLSMKTVHKNTHQAQTGQTITTANTNYMIHFCVSPSTSNYDGVYKLRLRFRQSNNSRCDAYVVESTSGYLNFGVEEPLDYSVEGNVIYREVDLTSYFSKQSQARYFSIITNQEISLYTSDASTGYKPELQLCKIEDDDLLEHQVNLDGSIYNDQYQVNVRSGKMYYDRSLMNVKTAIASINLSMSYNLNSKNSNTIRTGIYSGLGKGFKLNYQQIVYQNGSEYIYIDDKYLKHRFVLANNMNASSTNKVYYDKSGTYAILELTSTGYRIQKGNITLLFNTNGMLTKISKELSNGGIYEENITHDSSKRVTRIESSNYYINIAYQSNLITITSDDGRVVYIRMSNDLVSQITDEIGHITNYEYDEYTLGGGSSILGRAIVDKPLYTLNQISTDSKSIKFEYTKSYKIDKVINYYNNMEISRKVLTYSGRNTKVETLTQTYYLTTTFVYEFDDRGFVKTSYELINDKIGAVQHYELDELKDEVVLLINGNERYANDLEINEILNTGVDKVKFGEMPAGEYVLSFFTKINRLGQFDISGGYSCSANVYVDGLCKQINILDYLNNEYVEHHITVSLEDLSEVAIRVVNTLPNHQLKIQHIVLSPKPRESHIFSNTLSGQDLILSTNERTYYKDSIISIRYDNSYVLNNIKMSYLDLIETNKNKKFNNKNLIWYNNGKNLLFGLTSAVVSNGTSSVSVYELEGALIKEAEIIDKAIPNLKMYDFKQASFDSTNMYFNDRMYIKGDGYSYWKGIKETYDKYGNLKRSEEISSDETTPKYIEENVLDTVTNRVLESKVSKSGKIMSNVFNYDNRGFINCVNDGLEQYTYENNVLGSITKVMNGNIVLEENEYYADLVTLKKVKFSNNASNTINYTGLNLSSINNSSINYSYEYDSYGRLSKVKENNIVLFTYTYTLQLEYLTIKITNLQSLDTKEIKYDRYGRVVEVKENNILKITNTYRETNVNSSASKLRETTLCQANRSIIYSYDKYGQVKGITDNKFSTMMIKSNDQYDSTDGSHGYNETTFYGLGREQEIKEILKQVKTNDSNKDKYYKEIECNEFNETLHKYIDCITMDEFNRLDLKYVQLDNFEFKTLFEYVPDASSETSGNTTPYIYKEIFKYQLYQDAFSVNEYQYDRGLVTKKIKNGTIESFTYDNSNRITSYTKNGITKTYSYDEHGNIYFSDKTAIYNGQKLTSFNGKTIVYTNGYMTKYGNINISFANNRLMSYNGVNFTYDELGRRTCKSSSGKTVWSYYVGDRLLREEIIDSTGTHNIQYIYGVDGVLGFIYDNQAYIYRRNVFKDVEAIYNSSGTLVAEYNYDPFGNTTIVTNVNNIAAINPFRYRGYYYDVETGLFWLSSRYYSPELCRFISPDSVDYLEPESINGLNLYAYAKNNPIMYYDPSGHSAILVIGLLVGSFIVGAGASVVSQGLTYGWDEINYWQAGVDGLFALGSTALAMTGIGALASAGIGAVAGWSQYAIGSAFHGEDLTLLGSITAAGLGFIGGAISGAGARNSANIASKMQLTGKGASAVKAITTASNRYLAGEISMKGLQATARLWGNVALNAVQDAIAPTIRHLMIKGALTIAGVTIGTAAVNCGLYYAY